MTRGTLRIGWATNADLAAVNEAAVQTRELEHAAQFKSELRRQQYIASRAMLRALLAEHTGKPVLSFDLSADTRGKPECAGGPAVSISHSGDIVACAVMDAGDVGIDIEFPGRARNVTGIAERYFSPGEAEWLASGPSDRFYMLWVLKEAWLKAKGTGISGGLDQLRCIVTPPGIEPLPDSASFAALRLYAFGDGFLGAAALGTRPAIVEVSRWRPAQNAFMPDDGPELLASSDGE